MWNVQVVVVALLVPVCAAFAAWRLVPSGARRALAVALLRQRFWPGPVRAALGRVAARPSGCGCDGCDHAAPRTAAAAVPATPQVITFHRKPPR